MPDRMPDRMPENMSDRMPEDLPVTKCINVMVGITRSKVFFFTKYNILKLKVMPKELDLLIFSTDGTNTRCVKAPANKTRSIL